jgi:two-component system, cell cycle response regulator DivK
MKSLALLLFLSKISHKLNSFLTYLPAMTKILIVEDNEMNLDMLSRRLARKGYQVITAMDGAEGLQMANYEMPDLILMDMSLPGMDGWEATRHLKASPKTSAIPVIALTAHAMVGDREKAMQAGCNDYDTKPIEIDRLLTKMENLLNPYENS